LETSEIENRFWKEMTANWRENHRHESRNSLPHGISTGYVPGLDRGHFEEHYTPENFDKGVEA